MSRALLIRTLDAADPAGAEHDLRFEMVDELIRLFGESGLAEKLYEATPAHRPWRDLANVFGILIWSTSDNGHQLMHTMSRWLNDMSDERQVLIALEVGFVDMEKEEMITLFGKIVDQYPSAAAPCRRILEWREQTRERLALEAKRRRAQESFARRMLPFIFVGIMAGMLGAMATIAMK
jgi:hypothetical protein